MEEGKTQLAEGRKTEEGKRNDAPFLNKRVFFQKKRGSGKRKEFKKTEEKS